MKLTQDDRTTIINHTVKSVFGARKKKVRDDESDVAEIIYSALYPPDVQRKMSVLPDEFFNQASTMYLRLPSGSVQFNLASSRKVSAQDARSYGRPLLTNPVESLLTKAVDQQSYKKKLESDIDIFKKELKIFLSGIGTDKKLKEIWPEGEPYYQFLSERQPTTNLPAVQSTTVNAMIQQMKG